MLLDKIPTGANPPDDFNVVIEVPLGGEPIKYEIDKASGAMFVDRYLYTSMRYPCNYGFIPHTLSEDGDPLDVMVVGNRALVPGAVVRARPVGVVLMEDEKGVDEKVLAVPHPKLTRYYDNVADYTSLPPILVDRILHFFEHYKDMEPNKWVKVQSVEGLDVARRIISESIERAR